mgnify:CR=1 FL=1
MANTFRHGEVKIANEILEEIAIRAAEEIKGIHTGEVPEGKININHLGPKASVTGQDGKLNVDISVNLNQNVNVRKTIKAVQENVVRVIESMTGLKVSRVNVTVPKIEIQWID